MGLREINLKKIMPWVARKVMSWFAKSDRKTMRERMMKKIKKIIGDGEVVYYHLLYGEGGVDDERFYRIMKKRGAEFLGLVPGAIHDGIWFVHGSISLNRVDFVNTWFYMIERDAQLKVDCVRVVGLGGDGEIVVFVLYPNPVDDETLDIGIGEIMISQEVLNELVEVIKKEGVKWNV